MQISANMVKTLRERTGAGMMECKKALVEADGDMEQAVEQMRKSGLAKADKKAGRIAAEGAVVVSVSDDKRHAVVVEVNCETDFVAKGDEFQQFSENVAQRIMSEEPADLEALLALSYKDGEAKKIDQVRQELVAKIGENIQIRRFSHIRASEGLIGLYSHGGRIGVLVNVVGGDEGLHKDIAMHIAASRPLCVAEADMPRETVDKEREILTAQAQQEGSRKPADIIAKMVEGRLKKYLAEVTLLGQSFVKDPDQTVAKLLKGHSAKVIGFVRLEVGEGIEKKEENFAEEVMAQVRGG